MNASQKCPTCNSSEIDYMDCQFNRDKGEVTDEAICTKCHTSWVDVYPFSHQQGVKLPEAGATPATAYAWVSHHSFDLKMHTSDRRFFSVGWHNAKDGPLWIAHEYKDPAFCFGDSKWCATLSPGELFSIIGVDFTTELRSLASQLRPTGTSQFPASAEVKTANEFGGFAKKASTEAA